MAAIACGFTHTLMLDRDGCVWTMGRNSHGELGMVLDPNTNLGRGNVEAHAGVNTGLTPVDFRVYFVPARVEVLREMGVKVAKIAAGSHHNVALGTDGNVYTWGSNEYGQCGRLNEQPSTLRTQFVDRQPWALPPGQLRISPSVMQDATVVDVYAGPYDTAMVLSDGRVLMVGSYLSDESAPKQPFLLDDFEPQAAEGAPRKYLVQTLSNKQLAPPSHYVPVQKQVQPEESVLYSKKYAMKKLVLGIDFAVALVTPRK
jgi:alpha-tubulin suppressor-like RCC1 family protein